MDRTEGEKQHAVDDEDTTQTRWDRLKTMLMPRYHGDELIDELQDVPMIVFLASMAGLVFGGLIGARHAGDKYIALNHSTKFTSTMQAQRELHGAAMLGFVRHGSRWGWKMGLFAGIFSASNALLSVYRNKEDALNYVGAGALTGGLFRIRAGLKPAIGGTLLGTLICVPVGVLMQGLDLVLVGSEQREKIIRERKLKREKRWREKLQQTATLIEDMGNQEGLQKYYSSGTESEQNSSNNTTNSR